VPLGTPLPKPSSPEAKHLRSVVLDKYPFLEYVTRHVLYHTDAAANGSSQHKFLEDFPLEAWINLNNVFGQFEIRRYMRTASLLYILADNNFARLIRTAPHIDPRVDIQGERYQYPFFAALANGHRDVVKALLQEESSHLQDDISARLEYGVNFSARKDQTPLLWAAEKRHWPIVKLLLENGVNANAIKEGRTPL
jgi:hypothetical protein